MWVAIASGPGGAAAGRVVVRDPVGGAVYVAGSARVSAKTSEIMVVKYDAAGVRQWTAVYRHAGAGPQTAVDGAVDKAGDFIVLCAVRGPRTGGDWAVLDYTPSGARTWATTIAAWRSRRPVLRQTCRPVASRKEATHRVLRAGR